MNVHTDIRVTFRVDKDLKERAEKLFNHLGLNMSTALNIFLRKAVDEAAIPFTVAAKPAVYGMEYTSKDITNIFLSAVDEEITDKKRLGYPVARYDNVSKKAYLEVAEGEREYINGK